MCEYTDTTYTYTKYKEEDVKHKVAIQAYLLRDKAKPARDYCSDATVSRDAVIGSSGTGRDCPTCTSEAVGKTASPVLCFPSMPRRAAD